MPREVDNDPLRDQKITCVIDGDMADLLVVLNAYGVRVVMLPEYMGQTLKTRFEEATIESVLQSMALRQGPEAGVYQRDDHVYIGPPRDDDVGVRVFHMPYSEVGEWLQLYSQAITTNGSTATAGDVIVVRDTPGGLARVEALHEILASPRRSFEVELVYAELTSQQADALGVDIEAAGASLLDIRIDEMAESGVTLSLAASLQSILEASGGDAQTREWQTAVLHCIEGERAEMQVGDTVNIRRRVISPEGTVSEADTQSFGTGFLLGLGVHGMRDNRVRVDLEPEISTVRSFVDGVPQVATRRFTSAVYLGEGGVVVLGGLTIETDRHGRDRLPFSDRATGWDRTADRSRLFLFIRLKEVW